MGKKEAPAYQVNDGGHDRETNARLGRKLDTALEESQGVVLLGNVDNRGCRDPEGVSCVEEVDGEAEVGSLLPHSYQPPSLGGRLPPST